MVQTRITELVLSVQTLVLSFVKTMIELKLKKQISLRKCKLQSNIQSYDIIVGIGS
jgi:hypothetical protein